MGGQKKGKILIRGQKRESLLKEIESLDLLILFLLKE